MISDSQNPENLSQSEQNSDETGPTRFEDLPNEVIGQLFSHLDREDVQRIREVNRNFNQIVEGIFGLKMLITNEDYQDMVTSLTNRKKKVTWVIFKNLTLPIGPAPVEFLENIQTLEFHWITIGYNLLPILLNCPKLIHLKFQNVLIDVPPSFSPELAELPINLKKLKSLTIQSKSVTETGQNLIRHLNLLEKGVFGSIEKILLIYEDSTPLLSIQTIFNLDNPPTDPLMNFTWCQRKTLKLFQVRVDFDDLNESSSLKFEFHPFGSKDVDICPLQLKHGVFNQPIRPSWTHFLIWQGYLKTLQFDQCQVRNWDLIRSIIKRSEGTLEKLIICGQAFGQSWDSCLFVDCRNLAELRLEIHFAQKIGLVFLPFSITRLKIVAPIAKSELTRILSCVNLKSLIFENLSNANSRLPIPLPQQDSSQDQDDDVILDLKLFLNFLLLEKLEYFGLENIFRPFYNYDPLLRWCRKYPQGLLVTENSYLYQNLIILNGLTIKILPDFDREFVQDFSIDGEKNCQSSFCTQIMMCLNV